MCGSCNQPGIMTEYTLQVTTGSMLHAGTFDNLYVSLIGSERQSERTQLTSFGLDEETGKVSYENYNKCNCFKKFFFVCLFLKLTRV